MLGSEKTKFKWLLLHDLVLASSWKTFYISYIKSKEKCRLQLPQ
jgi:hypothetical protein